MSEETNRQIADYEILGGAGSGDKQQVFKVQIATADRASLTETSPREVSARGFCMGFGALVVLLVLVLGGLSFPWIARANASLTPDPEKTKAPAPVTASATHDSSHSQPVTFVVSQNTDPGSGNSGAASSGGESSSPSATDSGDKPVAEKKRTKAAKKIHRDSSVAPSIATEGGGSSAVGSVSPGPKDHPAQAEAETGQKSEDSEAAQLEELEREVDQLTSRAVTAADSLDELRRQQSAQGLGLRGNIATAQELVKTNLDKAQEAVQNRDVKSARKYMERAQPNLEKIEKFLGR